MVCLSVNSASFFQTFFLFLQFFDRTGVSKLHRVFHITRFTEYIPPAEPNYGGKSSSDQGPADTITLLDSQSHTQDSAEPQQAATRGHNEQSQKGRLATISICRPHLILMLLLPPDPCTLVVLLRKAAKKSQNFAQTMICGFCTPSKWLQ